MMRSIERVRRWGGQNGDDAGDHAPVRPDSAAGGNGAADKTHPEPPDASRAAPAAGVKEPQPPPSRDPPWLAQLDRAGIPRTLIYPSTTLGRILDQSADRFADATALVYVDLQWTYRELLSQVNRT